MKTTGLIYISKSKGMVPAEKFLSKEQLRNIFPEKEVILQVNYRKLYFGKSHSDRNPIFRKSWRTKHPAKRRLIYL